MSLTVGATLEKIAKGHLHLTRDEVFGLASQKFLTQHNIPATYGEINQAICTAAAKHRNSTHPHVKKLKLDGIMSEYDSKLKELYQTTVERAVEHFKKTVFDEAAHTVNIALAEDQTYRISSISQEAYLAGVRVILKQSRDEFRIITNTANKQAIIAGVKAAREKIQKIYSRAKIAMADYDDEEFDEDDILEDYDRTSGIYYDQLMDDVEEDARKAVAQPIEERGSMGDMLVNALFGNFYRTDLFTGNLYRAAQDGQKAVFDTSKDPAGQEWKYKWHAVLDDMTCDECEALDADPNAYYIDEFEFDPGDVHFWCRCDLDPVPPDEDPEDGENVDEDPLDGGPTNDEPGSLEDEAQDAYDDLMAVPRGRADEQTMFAMMDRQRVEDYTRQTSLARKLEDSQRGSIVSRAWGNTSDMVSSHFEQRHNIKVGGKYADSNWWKGFSQNVLRRELDMLVRMDKLVDTMIVDKNSPLSRLVTGGPRLTITRIKGVADNAAFFRPDLQTIFIHDGTLSSLTFMGFERNRIIIHELTHAAMNASLRGDKEFMGVINKLKEDWAEVNRLAETAGDSNAFATDYGRRSWLGEAANQEILKGNVDEDIADTVGYYMLKPGYLETNPYRQQKSNLIKDALFNGVEFGGD